MVAQKPPLNELWKCGMLSNLCVCKAGVGKKFFFFFWRGRYQKVHGIRG